MPDPRAPQPRTLSKSIQKRWAEQAVFTPDPPPLGPDQVLEAVRRMTPGQRRELAELLADAERSPFLWTPRPDGEWAPPTVEAAAV